MSEQCQVEHGEDAVQVIHYSRGRNIRDNRPEQRTASSWDDFIRAMEVDRAAAKKTSGYICGPLHEGRRGAENALPRAWLAVDLDRIEPDRLGDVCMWFMRHRALRWATHSSTAQAPRMRVLIALSRETSRGEAIAIGERLSADIADEFGAAVLVDPSTFRGEQPVFLPPPGGPLARCDGPPLDVDAYLPAGGLPKPRREPATKPHVDAETGELKPRRVGEGGRHAHLVRVAGGLNSRGLAPVAILAALMAENEANCEPPLPEAEVEGIWRDITRRYGAQHGQAAVARFLPPLDDDEGQPPGEWPDPILPGVKPPPEIPADVMPTWVRDMAVAVSESTQTPQALAVMVGLAVLAITVQRRFDVAPHGDDYTEPLALWTLTGLPSGTRKTAVINAMAGPLTYWEKLMRDRLRDDIAKVNAKRAVAKKRSEKLLLDAGKAKDEHERRALESEVQREELEMPDELRAPRLYTGDATAERVQQMLVEHGERMAVVSDEAGIFLVMAGLYNGGAANIDVWLQGHAGSPMRVDRGGRAAHVDKPAVSICLAIQPGVLSEVAGNRRFRDSGINARFLYAVPESNVGLRDVRLHMPVPAGVRDEYQRRVLGLLEGWDQPVTAPTTLTLEPAARECWLDLAERIERAQGEGGKLASICDWSSKLPGAVARVAAVLALAEHGLQLRQVPLASMERAVRLAELLVPHARAAFALLGADQIDADADAIVRWIKAGARQEFTRREAQKAQEGRFRTVERLKAALTRLEAQDVLRERKRHNRGAPPTVYFEVNPKVVA